MERIHVTIMERNLAYYTGNAKHLMDQVQDGCKPECSGQLLDAYLNALKLTKYSDKLNIYDYSLNSSSPYRDYDSKSPDHAYTSRKSPDNGHKSRTPDHMDKPRSPNNIHKSRSPDLIDKSRSPDEIYTPRYPDSVYKSKSPDNTHKSRSPDYIYESQDPDYSPQLKSPNNMYRHTSPNKVYKSKIPDKIRNTRSRDHINDSQDPDYSHQPRSPNNIYTSRSPDNIYKSKSPDSIRKSRSPKYFDESEDLDYNHKPRSPNNIYKPRNPDNVYKSKRPDSIRNARSPDHIDELENPDYFHRARSPNNNKNIHTPRSPENVYKSKSPYNIRKSGSRHHIYESQGLDNTHTPRSPNYIYESKSPDNVYKSKSPDHIRKSRSRHHTYESQSPDYTHKPRSPDHVYSPRSPDIYKPKNTDHIDTPRTPDNIRKSRSPDHILKSQDRDNINKPRSPDSSYSPRSPENVYKSRSPDRVNIPLGPVNFHKLINLDNSRPSSRESVRRSTIPVNSQRHRDRKTNLIPKEDIHKSQPTDVYGRAKNPHNIGYKASQHVLRPRSREEIDTCQDKCFKRGNKYNGIAKPIYPPKTVSSHGSTSLNFRPSSRSVSSHHSLRSDSGQYPRKTRSLHHTPRNINPQQMHRQRDREDCSKLVSSSRTQENICEPDFQDNAYECCQNSSKTYVIVVSHSVSTHKIPKVSNPHNSSKTSSPSHLPKSGGFHNSPTNVNPQQLIKAISQEHLYMQTSRDYIEKYIEKLHRSTSHLDKNSRQHIPSERPRRTSRKISPKIPSTRERIYRSSSEESDHRHNIQERDHRHNRRKRDRWRSSQEIDHKHRSWDKDYKSDIRDAEDRHSSQETIYRSGNLDRDYSRQFHKGIHKSRSWERDSERDVREKDFSHSSPEKVISPVNYESDCICGNQRSRRGSWNRDHSHDQQETEYRRDDKGIYYPYDNQQRVNKPNSYERDHSREKRNTVNRRDNLGNDYRRDNQDRVNRPDSWERDYERDKLGNDYRRDNLDRVNRPDIWARDYIRDNLGNDYRRDSKERVNRPDNWERDYTRDSRDRVNRPESWERDYQRDRRDVMNRPDGWERDYRKDSWDRVNRPDTWDRDYRRDNQERLNRPDTWEGDYRRDNQDRLNRSEGWDRDHRYYRPGRLDNVAGDYRGIDGDASKNVMQKGSLYDNYEDDKKYKEQKFKEKRHKYLWKRWERLTKRRSSDMDGLQRVLRQLGEFGPYQCMLLCVASPVFFMWAYILYAQIFVLATPSDYFCETENLRPKFACEIANVDLKGTPHITFFMGAFLGSIIFGVIADTKGRLYALVASNVVVVLGSVISALLNDLKAFAIARFFTGLGYDTCFMAIYILVVECVGPSKRAMAVNALIAVFFGIGGLLLPSIASLIANWQRFLVATSLPMLMVIAIRFMVPESLRWLLQRGKWTEAIRVIKKMQIVRKCQVHPEDLDRLMVETVNSPVKTGIRDAMSSPYIRIMVLIFCVLFFIVMMVFEFLILILEFTEVDFFKAFRYSAALEIPAGLVGGFLVNNCGRRLLTWVPMVATAVYVIAAHYYFEGVVFATLVIMARLYIAVSRNTLFLWMTEVMPTGARASGSGLAHASGHLGCIVAPIFAHMVGIHKIYWPLIFMGALLIFSTIVVCMLPETCHRPLPQKISAAKKRFQQSLRNFKSKFTVEGLAESVKDRRRREYDKSPLAQPMTTPAAYGDTPPLEDPLRPIMPRQWRTSDGII